MCDGIPRKSGRVLANRILRSLCFVVLFFVASGMLVVNDVSAERLTAVRANFARLGVRNAIICNYDASYAFPKIMGGFDRVILDAPCSGTGVASRDPSGTCAFVRRGFVRRECN